MPYLALLGRPHVVRLLSSSLVGRLPGAMAALGIALTLRHAGYGYQLVGLTTGVFAAAGAIGGPMLGRLVDRTGQPRTLLFSSCLAAAGFALLAAAPGTPWAAVAGAAVAGAAAPPLEPCLRTLWPELVEPDDVESAYAVDAGAQELLFIAGPLVVAGIVVLAPARDTLWAAAVLGLVGSAGMATAAPSRAWAPAAKPVAPHWLGPLRSTGLLLLLVALVGSGVAVGTFNVFTVAYAEKHHLVGGAGTLLALSALGALVGALTYGAVGTSGWKASAPSKAVLLAAGMAGSYWLVALVPGPAGNCLLALLTGVFFAPLLTVSFGLVGELAPAGAVTEAFAWLVTFIGVGIALGAAVGGVVLSDGTLRIAAACGALGATLGAATLLAARTRLTPVHADAPSAAAETPRHSTV
ncbi:MFS family permease [Kitasatospora sp. MAP12-15]|uniref:MFS transporter n=1 Tax=unclassified Kitasatospora TaxID=2633591 RepID=UPI002472F164|nr:MFS transporter [Kitasatospora sp. MAP12-44]MDH6111716.1 MFS family permease [Kitasatospora sp. MAP12-44]